MIPYDFIQILHKGNIVLCVAFLSGDMPENGRGIDCFRQRPVHSVMNDRRAIPVGRIYQSRCAIDVPGIGNGSLI